MSRAILALFLLLTLSLPAAAGVYYKAETRTEGDYVGTSQVEAWVDGRKVRMVMHGDGGLPGNGYLLTSDAGTTVYLVNPEERTYSRWNIDEMMATAGSAMNMVKGMMNMEFSDPQVTRLAEKPDGKLLGQPVTFTHYRTAYTMKMSMFGMGSSTSVIEEDRIWTTEGFPDEGMRFWTSLRGASTGNEAIDKRVQSEMEKLQGFPLKRITEVTSTDDQGNTRLTRTTLAVTELKQQGVAASEFEIPAGFRETSMMEAVGQGGGQGQGGANSGPGDYGSILKGIFSQ